MSTLGLKIIVAALAALLLAAGLRIYQLQRYVDAVSPGGDQRNLVERAVRRLARNDRDAAELRRMHPVVFDLGDRQCVDFRPRKEHDGSGLVCFGRDGRVHLEIQRGSSFGS